MTSAFGGQHSIQLSYGCVFGVLDAFWVSTVLFDILERAYPMGAEGSTVSIGLAEFGQYGIAR